MSHAWPDSDIDDDDDHPVCYDPGEYTDEDGGDHPEDSDGSDKIEGTQYMYEEEEDEEDSVPDDDDEDVDDVKKESPPMSAFDAVMSGGRAFGSGRRDAATTPTVVAPPTTRHPMTVPVRPSGVRRPPELSDTRRSAMLMAYKLGTSAKVRALVVDCTADIPGVYEINKQSGLSVDQIEYIMNIASGKARQCLPGCCYERPAFCCSWRAQLTPKSVIDQRTMRYRYEDDVSISPVFTDQALIIIPPEETYESVVQSRTHAPMQ